MNTRAFFVLLPTAALLAGCAAFAPPPAPEAPKFYSSADSQALTACSARATTAHSVAQAKAAGRSRDEIAAQFRRGSTPDTVAAQIAIVDKVYAEPAERPLDYATQVFNQCAAQSAKVDAGREAAARHCFLERTVAIRAAAMRAQGREKADAILAISVPGVDVSSVVARAFDGRRTPNLAGQDAWQLCIKDFTAA